MPDSLVRGTRVSPNDGGINDEPLHIWGIDKVLVQPLKDSFIAPSCKSFVDAVPIAVGFWEQMPLAATTSYPKHRLDKTL